MSGGKLGPGGDPFQGPLNPDVWNSVIDARDDHLRRTAQRVTSLPGNGRPYRPNWTRNWHSVIQVRNMSGASLRAGDVIEFNGNPLSIAENDTLWLTGVAVDLTHVGWGITLEPLAHNASSPEIGPVLLVGGCIANVQITNNDHKYATRKAGSTTLTSAERGPVKILHKPSGSVPGERRCHVQIMDEDGDRVELVEVHHPSPAANGQVVEANANGYHQGRIRMPNGTATYTIGEEVWLQFADGHDGYPNDDGQVLAVHGENYFAKDTGQTWGEGENERPLYVAICDERSFLGVSASPIAKNATGTVALIHSHNFESADIGKSAVALHDIPPSALVKVTRRAGVWMVELLDKTLVHFELLQELKLTGTGSGHAKAKILTWNGSAWAGGEGVEIEVYDWFPGRWNGLAGYRGLAEYRPTQYTDPGEDEEDPEDDVLRPVYEIIWMERPAQLIRFTTTAASGEGGIPATVGWYDWQGRDPGSSVTVHDPDGVFPDVFEGAKGVAYYNNKDRRYEILRCQRIVIFAEATLSAAMCGSSASITDFVAKPCGEFVGSPPTAPTSATNPNGVAGVSGSTVTLRRISNSMTWEVIGVTRVLVKPIVALDLLGLEFRYRTADCYLERCTTDLNDWEAWHTGEAECP